MTDATSPKRRIPGDVWSADVQISQPVPVNDDAPPMVSMGGFAFTAHGLKLNLTEADREEFFSPYFQPGDEG